MNISPDIAPFKSNEKGPNAAPISSKLETIYLAKCVYLYSKQDTVALVLVPKVSQSSWPSLQPSLCLHFIQDPHVPSYCKDCHLVSWSPDLSTASAVKINGWL